MIKENCHLNHMRVEGNRTGRQLDGAGDADSPVASVEVVKMDANVIMHLRPFDYMWVRDWKTMTKNIVPMIIYCKYQISPHSCL